MTTEITLSALQPGDVLLFQGMETDLISSTIMYLTNSRVSHAAMVYSAADGDKGATLVHEASPKVPLSVRDAAASFGDREITVRRQPDSLHIAKAPLIAAADAYLLEKAPYNNNGLYLVGVLLIYKKFIPDSKTSKLIARLIKLATRLIVHQLNRKSFPSQHPMTCSQFVAQCYDDAGADYRLFHESLLDTANAPEETGSSLLDQALQRLDSDRAISAVTSPEAATAMSEQQIIEQAQQLAGELLQQLEQEQSASSDTNQVPEIDDELSAAIGEFASSLHQLQHADLDQAATANSVVDHLKWLKEQRNLFVSPADLLNCARLETSGVIHLK